MDTKTPIPSIPAKKGQTPWGVIIAILLILAIVVSGAYYAFTERISPTPSTIDAGVSL